MMHGACYERLAYVMEFCGQGAVSFVLVRDDVTLTWERRIAWATQIAKALDYLHTRKPKIIHRCLLLFSCALFLFAVLKIDILFRDLKTDNVLVRFVWEKKIFGKFCFFDTFVATRTCVKYATLDCVKQSFWHKKRPRDSR